MRQTTGNESSQVCKWCIGIAVELGKNDIVADIYEKKREEKHSCRKNCHDDNDSITRRMDQDKWSRDVGQEACCTNVHKATCKWKKRGRDDVGYAGFLRPRQYAKGTVCQCSSNDSSGGVLSEMM